MTYKAFAIVTFKVLDDTRIKRLQSESCVFLAKTQLLHLKISLEELVNEEHCQ